MNNTEPPVKADHAKNHVRTPGQFTASRLLGILTFLFVISIGVKICRTPPAAWELYYGILMVSLLLILTFEASLAERMGRLLDCLEKKGVLTAEERAATGWHRPRIDPDIVRGAPWLLLIILGGAFVLIALGFLVVTCRR